MSLTPDKATVCSRLLHRTRFLVSATSARDCPPDRGIEIAFAGRSNAGKSSALNALVQQGSLARTSKTPGRTQLINFFEVDADRRLVDLPGYGYAKVSADIQARWHEGLDDYFQHRSSLAGIVLVMDIRHPFSDFDRMMLDASQHRGLKIHCLLTKADKLNRNELIKAKAAAEKELRFWPGASAQPFSATAKTGLEAAWELLGEWLGIASP